MIKTLAEQIVDKCIPETDEYWSRGLVERAFLIDKVESLLTSFVEELVGEDEPESKHTNHEIDEDWCINCSEQVDDTIDGATRNWLRDHLRQKAKGEL